MTKNPPFYRVIAYRFLLLRGEVYFDLANKGLKKTHQRIVVYQAMMDSVDHPTAEQIFDQIKSENPAISLATVASQIWVQPM